MPLSTPAPPPFHLRVGGLVPDGEPPSGPAAEKEAESLRLMVRAARAEPHDPDYFHILAGALLRVGKVGEALSMSRQAVEGDPANGEYRLGLGAALWCDGQTDEAERAFREAVERRPDDVTSLNALGAALVRLGREDEAVSVLRRALKVDPHHADAHSNLGVALWGAGDPGRALRGFRRAARLDTEQLELVRNLALAQRAQARAPRAVRVLQGAVRRWPRRADLRVDLAEALHEAGRFGEAARALDEAQGLDPTALARRPRAREVRDGLRLRGVRGEIEHKRRTRRRPLTEVANRLLDGLEWLDDLRPRFRILSGAGLLAALAVAWMAWSLAPPYVTHYLLADDIATVARAPVQDDGVVRERLRRTILRRGLEDRIDADRCEITTDPGWRRIACEYAVTVHILPGVRRTLRLRVDVEQPFLADPDPVVL
jgi:tetratricopeptide (TPR) repeat protein